MPHFLVDCAAEVLKAQDEKTLLKEIHETANASGLFNEGDIKVRLRPYDRFLVGNASNKPFLHVFAYIMEGRTKEQKASLSKSMVTRLTELLPEAPVISMNVQEFEKATYCNRMML